MAMLIAFLGTGASGGTPVVGCKCRACEEARSIWLARRRPTSILVLTGGKQAILLDAGFDVTRYVDGLELKAILITHWHHDHIAGLFRLRWARALRLPVYGPNVVEPEIAGNPLSLDVRSVEAFEEFDLAGLKVTPLRLRHSVETLGYLLEEGGKRAAFLFDTKGLPNETLDFLRSRAIDLAVIDANFPPGHERDDHNNVDQAIEIGDELGAKAVVLTHIDHCNLPFSELVRYVVKKSPRVSVAYDGMVFHMP